MELCPPKLIGFFFWGGGASFYQQTVLTFWMKLLFFLNCVVLNYSISWAIKTFDSCTISDFVLIFAIAFHLFFTDKFPNWWKHSYFSYNTERVIAQECLQFCRGGLNKDTFILLNMEGYRWTLENVGGGGELERRGINRTLLKP